MVSEQQDQPAAAPTPPKIQAPGAPTVGATPTQAPPIQPAPQQGLAPMTPPAPQPPMPAPAQPTVAAIPTTPTSGFGPENDLRTTQINPTASPRLAGTQGMVDSQAGKLATGPDRFQLAQDRFKTYSDQTDPAFQASIRSATQNAAANGAVGSGELGTQYGNLALQHTRDLGAERDTLFNNALEGTIGDTRANVGLLSGLEGQQYGEGEQAQNDLRGERGYQNGMEQQAYDRGIQGLTLEDALTNSAFGRGQAQSQAGEANNPANTQMLLSGLYGQQASGAGQALSGLVQNTTANSAINQALGAYGQPKAQTPIPQGTPVDGGIPGYQSPLLSGLS